MELEKLVSLVKNVLILNEGLGLDFFTFLSGYMTIRQSEEFAQLCGINTAFFVWKS